MNSENEKKILKAGRKLLEHQEEKSSERELLDSLANIRAQALKHLPDNEKSTASKAKYYFSAALAASLLALAIFVIMPSRNASLVEAELYATDFEMLMEEDLELLEEEVEFYYWLEDQG